MGGAAPMTSGAGGRKALDAAMNLVPFIDLLSCCISFLLITAVWSAVAAMPVGQDGKGVTDERPPPAAVRLTLHIDRDGYLFARSTGEMKRIPRVAGDYDRVQLATVLRAAKVDYPEKFDLSVRAADAIPYAELVRAMDVAMGERWSQLSVEGQEGG